MAADTESCGASPEFVRGALLLQEKWVLFIVHSLLDGPAGFNELSRQARGVNATTLSQRLDMLEHLGLVTKTVQSVMPPRTSYALTPAGQALRPTLDAIEAWSRDHFPADDPAVDCPAMSAQDADDG